MQFLINRLKEKSTYVGLFMLISMFAGWEIRPDMKEQIISLGGIVAGILSIFLSEKGKVIYKRQDWTQEELDDAIRNEPQRIVTPDINAGIKG